MTLQEAASALAAAASQAEADANFSKLYAIVGSMFDSTVSLPEQLSTIEHLPAEQRWRSILHAAVHFVLAAAQSGCCIRTPCL